MMICFIGVVKCSGRGFFVLIGPNRYIRIVVFNCTKKLNCEITLAFSAVVSRSFGAPGANIGHLQRFLPQRKSVIFFESIIFLESIVS